MFFYLARSFAVYSGIFFALALPWLRIATHAAPGGEIVRWSRPPPLPPTPPT